MPARFDALGYDRVAARRFEPARLAHCGCRTDDLRARRPHTLQQGAFGKAEMEADHLWPDPLDQFAMPAAEAAAMLLDLLCRPWQAHFLEIILQAALPRIGAERVIGRWLVTKGVKVDARTIGVADRVEGGPRFVRSAMPKGSEPRPPSRATAEISAGVVIPGHWRLYDREINSEQVEDATVGPGHSMLAVLTSARHARRRPRAESPP